MDYKKKINEMELRIFNLEKNIDNMGKKISQLKDSVDFYYDGINNKEEQVDRGSLLSIKEACEILNISETKLNEWIQKKLIKEINIGNDKYFDKKELRNLFRTMKVNNS
mgnify:CR=1 FL=1